MQYPTIIDSRLDFTAMTIAELKTELLRLATVGELVNDQRKAIFQLVERREAEARAAERVGAMSDIQKDALRTVLSR